MTQKLSPFPMEVGRRYTNGTYATIGPIETIDVNGWAWAGDKCWNAKDGTYYATGKSPQDIVGLAPEPAPQPNEAQQ